jgi:cytochrome c oxidase cbb3-type subunit 3
MNDFINDFWPMFINVISLGGILACALLLWKTSKTKVTKSKDGTSGHVWDEDLKEMNNPLPVWWVRLFAITIVFSLVYLVLYPGLGSYEGQLGWTKNKQYDKEIAEANKALEPIYAKYAAMSIEDLSKNEDAKGIGQRLFLNSCAQCHGSDARGSRGFPNLTDRDWLYGGSPENIKETIIKGRMGVMPPMASLIGNDDEIKNVTHYVLSLSNNQHDAKRAELGKEKFTTVCAACHGTDGKGNQLLGAPNLSDSIWLHGSGEANIVKRIHEGKTNQMPQWQEKFSPEQIHVLTSYVWGMSNH